MKKSLLKDSIRQIKNTFKRFLSILLIVLLGVGFFAGMQATSPDMKEAIDKYFDEQNMMDIEVLSTLGLTDEDINALKNLEGVSQVNSGYSFDASISTEKKEIVVKVESMPEDINKITLLEGNLPENSDECVVEKAFLSDTQYKIGDYITINPEKMDSEDSSVVKTNKIKIVGTIESSQYISRTRGTSKIGSGTVDYYMYMPKENINMSAYTVAYLTVNGATELQTYNDDYEDLISNVKDEIEEISAERKQVRYDDIINEATEKLNDAQSEYEEEKKKAEDELSDGENKINEAKDKIAKGETELENSKKKAQTEFANAEKKIKEAQEQIAEAKEQFNNKKSTAEEQINNAQTQLNTLQSIKQQYNQLLNQKSELEKQIATIEETLQILNQNPVTNADKIQELTATKAALTEKLTKTNYAITAIENNLTSQGIQVSNLDQTISAISAQISNGKQELAEAEKQITDSEKELEQNKNKLASTKKTTNNKLKEAEKELENAKTEISENEIKLQDAKKEAEEKLDEAQQKLNDARNEINKIEKPTWYILDRNSNYGYVEYIQDTDRISSISKVFPAVFFVVAALISLTSMSRMIEEQRVQIGTLKALGYNKVNISMKYIIYAFLATVIGGAIGMSIGFYLIPSIIWNMYNMMYILPEVQLKFRLNIGLIGLILALICTLGATIYTCVNQLKEKPATLMLPRAPKPGKRILLERIKFIWSKLKFTQKVTARNIFRYKKKFLMTIIGVAGCTALIVAGFSIRDSVSQMIPKQYGEIFKYDGIVTLSDNITNNKIQEELNKIEQEECVYDTIPCYMKTVEITNIENSQTINLVVINPNDDISNFINIRSRKDKKTYTLDKENVIISEKISKLLKIKVGDKITIKNTNDIEKDITVGEISETYIGHYIYMSNELYNTLYGENSYKPNTILIKEKENTEASQEESLGKTLLENKDIVSGITFLSNTKDIFGKVMEKMQLVVYILIVAAALLAFAVLYNLSNVNISERIRELATLKVLGFYNKEVFNYITKETRILTGIGIILGLFAGYFLGMYIIKTCELDTLMFVQEVKPMSFVYGFVITIIFAEIVNIAVNHTLKKISMTESLKSID